MIATVFIGSHGLLILGLIQLCLILLGIYLEHIVDLNPLR